MKLTLFNIFTFIVFSGSLYAQNLEVDIELSIRLEKDSLGKDMVIFQVDNVGNKVIKVPQMCVDHNRVILVTPKEKEYQLFYWSGGVSMEEIRSGQSTEWELSYDYIIEYFALVTDFAPGQYQLYWKVYRAKSNRIAFNLD